MLQGLKVQTYKRYLILGIIILILVAALGIWIAPRLLGLYYQVKGGTLLEQAVVDAGVDLSSAIPCSVQPLPESSRPWVDQAIQQLQTALAYTPRLAQASLLLGRAFCLLGEPKEAVNAYQKYLNLRPENPLGRLELGFAYELVDQLPSAIKEWKKSGAGVQDFINIALSMSKDNQFQEGQKWIDRAGKLGLPSGDIQYYIGRLFEDQGKWEKALAKYFSALADKNHSATSDIYYHIGLVEQERYNPLAAIGNFEESIDTNDFSSNILKADALFRYAVLEEGQGKPSSEHIGELEEAVRLDPYQYGAYASLGTAYYQAYHDFERAYSNLQISMTINPKFRWSYIRLAEIYFDKKDWKACADIFDQAYRIFGDDQELNDKLNSLNMCNQTFKK